MSAPDGPAAHVRIRGTNDTEVAHVDAGLVVDLEIDYDDEEEAQEAEQENATGHVTGREGTTVTERYVGPYDG